MLRSGQTLHIEPLSAADFFEAVVSHNETALDSFFSTAAYSFFGSDDDGKARRRIFQQIIARTQMQQDFERTQAERMEALRRAAQVSQ